MFKGIGGAKGSSRKATSVAVLAEISLRSPRKISIFTIKKYILWIEVSRKTLELFLEKKSLVPKLVVTNEEDVSIQHNVGCLYDH